MKPLIELFREWTLEPAYESFTQVSHKDQYIKQKLMGLRAHFTGEEGEYDFMDYLRSQDKGLQIIVDKSFIRSAHYITLMRGDSMNTDLVNYLFKNRQYKNLMTLIDLLKDYSEEDLPYLAVPLNTQFNKYVACNPRLELDNIYFLKLLTFSLKNNYFMPRTWPAFTNLHEDVVSALKKHLTPIEQKLSELKKAYKIKMDDIKDSLDTQTMTTVPEPQAAPWENTRESLKKKLEELILEYSNAKSALKTETQKGCDSYNDLHHKRKVLLGKSHLYLKNYANSKRVNCCKRQMLLDHSKNILRTLR